MDTHLDRDSSIRKLAELIGEIRIAMLTTTTEDGSIRSRPMTTQLAKFDGKLWFFTKRESPKADEIRRHRRVSLSYAKPEDNSYVSISGTAELITDQKKAQELWDPSYEQWFPQGASDPSLILIRVTVEQAEYWHAPSSAFTLQAGFVVLAPERRAQPGVPLEDRDAERVRPGHHHQRPCVRRAGCTMRRVITGHSPIFADQGTRRERPPRT